MRIRFRFRPIALLATVLLVALGVSLGQWQERRAAQKTALQHKLVAHMADAPLAIGAALMAPGPLELRRVTVRGQFVAAYPLFLNNRPLNGRAGFYLVMPLKIDGSDTCVLVARGWLARNAFDVAKMAPYATPAGSVTLEGVVKTSIGHIMELGTPEPVRPGAIVQNIAPAQFAQASGLSVQPFFIEQSDGGRGAGAGAADGLARNWPAPSLGVEKHQGYAFQWYALAVMALLFFVMTGFRRGTNDDK